MKAKSPLLLFLLLFLTCLSWRTETMANHQNASELSSMLADLASIMKQFEQTTDRVNFSQWNAPYGVTSGMRTYLDGTRSEVRNAKIVISQMHAATRVLTVQLFEMFVALAHTGAASSQLAQAQAQFSSDYTLGSDLFSVTGSAGKMEDKFHDLLVNQLTAVEIELATCRARAH